MSSNISSDRALKEFGEPVINRPKFDLEKVIQNLREPLEQDIKEQILNTLVEDFLKDIETHLRERLQPMVEQFSFEKIEKFHNMLEWRDSFNLTFTWKDSPKK